MRNRRASQTIQPLVVHLQLNLRSEPLLALLHLLRRDGARCIVAVVRSLLIAGIAFTAIALAATDGSLEFSQSVRPVLAQNCGGCHSAENPKNRVDFLKATTAKDIESKRGLWRSVAAQLRNRTMPPVASKLSEDDRFRIATWVEDRLRLMFTCQLL